MSIASSLLNLNKIRIIAAKCGKRTRVLAANSEMLTIKTIKIVYIGCLKVPTAWALSLLSTKFHCCHCVLVVSAGAPKSLHVDEMVSGNVKNRFA